MIGDATTRKKMITLGTFCQARMYQTTFTNATENFTAQKNKPYVSFFFFFQDVPVMSLSLKASEIDDHTPDGSYRRSF